ncbi:dimethylarginine dimethylaminohydrolase family protein [Nakamurella sp. GG22]
MTGGAVRDRLLPDARQGRVLVRRPGPRLSEGLLTHIDRSPVDPDKAAHQWAGYVAAFEANGWPAIEVEPAPDCADAPFIEDTMVVSGDFVVIARPGAVARQAETVGAGDVVRALGMGAVEIIAPGTLDGGDVLKLGLTWFVGVGGRTNDEGLRQLIQLTAPRGITVVPLPISGVLHLKSAITALPDGTLLANVPAIGRPDLLPPLTPSPDRGPWRMILLGGDRVLLSTSAPRTAELLVDRGYTPIVVDISEFEKLEASVTCLSVRLRGSLTAG